MSMAPFVACCLLSRFGSWVNVGGCMYHRKIWKKIVSEKDTKRKLQPVVYVQIQGYELL